MMPPFPENAWRAEFVTSSATMRPIRQHCTECNFSGAALTRQLDVLPVQFRAHQRLAELPQIQGGVDQRVVIRHLQGELDSRPAFESLAYPVERDLDFGRRGARGGRGNDSNRRGELVAHPMGELVEQQPVLRGR